jgi:hypothetical protein
MQIQRYDAILCLKDEMGTEVYLFYISHGIAEHIVICYMLKIGLQMGLLQLKGN